jgi:hypothetical protein
MSVQAGLAQLSHAAKDLVAAWLRAREQWHDANAERFEREYIELFQAELRRTAGALQTLNALLEHARRDCQ